MDKPSVVRLKVGDKVTVRPHMGGWEDGEVTHVCGSRGRPLYYVRVASGHVLWNVLGRTDFINPKE